MTKIKLRGLKLLERGAQVVSSNPGDYNFLAAGICSPLALHKINLTFLSHAVLDQSGRSITAFCTEGSAGRGSASLVEAHQGGTSTVDFHGDMSTLSVFPHDQRPEVTGLLLHALAKREIALQGIASSPSAVSSIVSTAETEAAIHTLFDAFEFPAYHSPSDWYAAYEGKENLLRKIIASYQEKVVRIYDIVRQSELDLWSVVIGQKALTKLGEVLLALGQRQLKMPFVIALLSSENMLVFNFCFPGGHESQIRETFASHLGETRLARHSQVAALYIHGPHFGDRYGIANTLVRALERGGVSLLALGCTVSSISVIIREEDLAAAVQTLEATFQRSSG
ncbi:MAG: ACT domain-containing protein [Deltaproteobacteria bacterium]|nr:ACT domain-containing protein [Deltaproteobacteria bacterium]